MEDGRRSGEVARAVLWNSELNSIILHRSYTFPTLMIPFIISIPFAIVTQHAPCIKCGCSETNIPNSICTSIRTPQQSQNAGADGGCNLWSVKVCSDVMRRVAPLHPLLDASICIHLAAGGLTAIVLGIVTIMLLAAAFPKM